MSEVIADWDAGNMENDELIEGLENVTKNSGRPTLPVRQMADVLFEGEAKGKRLSLTAGRAMQKMNLLSTTHSDIENHGLGSEHMTDEDKWAMSSIYSDMKSRIPSVTGKYQNGTYTTNYGSEDPMDDLWDRGEAVGANRAREMLKEKFPNGGTSQQYANYLKSLVPDKYRYTDIGDAPSPADFNRIDPRKKNRYVGRKMARMFYSGVNTVIEQYDM